VEVTWIILASVVPAVVCVVLLVAVPVLAVQWRRKVQAEIDGRLREAEIEAGLKRAELEAKLKQQALERGLSVAEIEQLVKSSSAAARENDGRAAAGPSFQPPPSVPANNAAAPPQGPEPALVLAGAIESMVAEGRSTRDIADLLTVFLADQLARKEQAAELRPIGAASSRAVMERPVAERSD
jgi:hypothetical protein